MILAGLGLMGACGGDDGGGNGEDFQPHHVFDRQVAFFQQLCLCDPNATRTGDVVLPSDPCVSGNVDTGAVRDCKEQALEARWDELASAGACNYRAYDAGITCLENLETCEDVGACFVEYSADLDACPSSFFQATSDC